MTVPLQSLTNHSKSKKVTTIQKSSSQSPQSPLKLINDLISLFLKMSLRRALFHVKSHGKAASFSTIRKNMPLQELHNGLASALAELREYKDDSTTLG